MPIPQVPQPRFSVIVRKPDGTNPLEMTADIDAISLSIDQDMIAILSFEVSKTQKYIDWIDLGYRIDFYGGYLVTPDYFSADGAGGFNYSPGSSNEHFRYLFNGTVHTVNYNFKETGKKSLVVEAKDFSWGAMASKKDYYAYPSADNARGGNFSGQSMTLTEIVKALANEMGVEADIQVKVNTEYTQDRPCVQNGTTDWAFLRNLAKQNGCYVWTNVDPTTKKYTLYFIDRDKAVNKEHERIEFVWLDRDDNAEFIQGGYLPTGNQTDEMSKLAENQIQIKSCSVEYNPQMIGSNGGTVITQVTEWDEETGTQKQKLVSYDEDAENIIYYELDKAKVDALVKENPDEANRISNMGAFGIDRDTFMEYYTEVKIPKGNLKAIDRPFHGINVTATIDGDVNIEPFQSYRIYGIGKWSTRKQNKALRHYLYGITHSWSAGIFSTELRFRA